MWFRSIIISQDICTDYEMQYFVILKQNVKSTSLFLTFEVENEVVTEIEIMKLNLF